ncbi:MAG: MGMT family protein [Elusimicrobiota bacterium]
MPKKGIRGLPKHVMRKFREYPRFFQKVWRECARIPRGSTLSYGEIAKRIGCPKGARAVAQALARNPFAPYVPCHRVIKSDGILGGFSGPGGIKTKMRLLKKEKDYK